MDEVWTVPGVYLLATRGEGEVAVPELALSLSSRGVELHKPDGDVVWSRMWADLRALAPVQRSVLPDGSDGIVVDVVERGQRGRRHRFVVPADDPAVMEEMIANHARAHGLQADARRQPVSVVLTGVIVVAAIATITILLLSAAHVISL